MIMSTSLLSSTPPPLWVTANVNKCAVAVGNEDEVNPLNFNWMWEEDELPIVDQYTSLGVEISTYC